VEEASNCSPDKRVEVVSRQDAFTSRRSGVYGSLLLSLLTAVDCTIVSCPDNTTCMNTTDGGYKCQCDVGFMELEGFCYGEFVCLSVCLSVVGLVQCCDNIASSFTELTAQHWTC